MRHPPRQDPRKRLIGFGPAGWFAAAGLVLLLQAMARGVDVRYHIFATIERTLGIDAVYWIVSHALPWHHFAISEGRFGLVAALYWLVALQIYPERKSLLWPGLLLAWGVAAPMLPQEIIGWFARRSSNPASFFAPGVFADWFMGIVIACELVAMALLIVMTRSRVVAAAAAIGVLVSALLIGGEMRWGPVIRLTPGWSPRLDPWLWHAIMGGAAMWWAISARQRAVGPGQCQSCGYDRRGLMPGARCPECGTAPHEASRSASRKSGHGRAASATP